MIDAAWLAWIRPVGKRFSMTQMRISCWALLLSGLVSLMLGCARKDVGAEYGGYVGRPASVRLDDNRLAASDLMFIDEPPGKLRAFTFARSSDGKKLIVRIEYSEALFSTERRWDFEQIRAAKVLSISEYARDTRL